MAEKIDLGELELSITANTKGLKSVGGSIRALRADLQKDMAAIANSMKTMEKGMQAIATATTKSTQTVTRSQGAVKQSLDRTQKALFSVGNKYRDLSVSTRLATVSSSQKAAALGQLDAAYRRVLSDLKAANGDTNKVTAAMQRFTNSSKNVTRNTREWSAALKNTAAKKAADDIKKLSISTTDLSKAVQVALGPLSGVASRITAIAGLANRNTLAIAAMTAGLIGFGAVTFKAIKLAADYEKQMRQLSNRVAIFGREIGVTTHELDAMAVSLGSRTLASAEGARQALVALTGIVGITKENLEEALEASQRLSDAGFGNLRTSARRLTRILSDPVQAMESLRTMGVRLSLSQRELVKDMLAVGNISGAQATILASVKERFDGVNGAINTTAGAYDDLLEKTKIFFQQMGAQGGILEPVTDGLKALSAEIDRSMGPDAVGNVSRFSAVMKTTLESIVGALKFVIRQVDFLAVLLLSTFAGSVAKTVVLGISSLIASLQTLATTLKLAAVASGLLKFGAILTTASAIVPALVAIGVAGAFMFSIFEKSKEFKRLDELKDKLKTIKKLTETPKSTLQSTQKDVDAIKARITELKALIATEKMSIGLNNLAETKTRQMIRANDKSRQAIKGYKRELKESNKVVAEATTLLPVVTKQLKQMGMAGSNAGTHMPTLANQLEKIAKAVTQFGKGAETRRSFEALGEAFQNLSSDAPSMELINTLASLVPNAADATERLAELNIGLIHTREGLQKLKTDVGQFQIINKGGLIAFDDAALQVKIFARLTKEQLLEAGATLENYMSKLQGGPTRSTAAIIDAVKAQDKANRQLRDLNTVLNNIDRPIDVYIRKLKIIKGLNTSQGRKDEAIKIALEGMTQEIALREKLNIAQGKSDALLNAGLGGLEDFNHESKKYSHLLAQKLIPDTATMANMYEKLIAKSKEQAKAYIQNADAAFLAAKQTEGLQAAMEVLNGPVDDLEKQILKIWKGYDGTAKTTKTLIEATQKLKNEFTGQDEALKQVALAQGGLNSLQRFGLAGQREYTLQAEIFSALLANDLIPKTATMANMYSHLGHRNHELATDTINATIAIHDQKMAYSDLKQVIQDIQTPYDKYLEQVRRLTVLYDDGQISLERYNKALTAYQEQLASSEPRLKAITDAFNGVTDSIADMVVAGEFEFAKFGVIIDNFVRDTMSKLIKLMLFAPIQKAFLGFATSAIGSFMPQTPAGLTGPANTSGLLDASGGGAWSFHKKGASFSGGVRKLASGGVLDSPTLFGSKGGMNLAGEAGTEAVMPLARTANGDLGVQVAGGSGGGSGGGVIVNIYNNSDSQARSETTPMAGGGEKIDIFIDKVVSGLVRDPRSRTSNSLHRATSSSPKLVGR